jgi:hypothetical protein
LLSFSFDYLKNPWQAALEVKSPLTELKELSSVSFTFISLKSTSYSGDPVILQESTAFGGKTGLHQE